RKGLRTVVICRGKGSLYSGEEPVIPELEAVAAISIRDEIRTNCRETIGAFLDNGMDLKVISGDDPATVDAMFSLAGIPGNRNLITGPALSELSGEEKEKAVLESNIFGRMKPEDKEEVIDILVRNGRYVAMIGDGVNDVKSLKAAQVGISLESGSNAARGVSDMILVNDDFAALPKAVIEGRRTVSGMRDILKLYLTRNFALALMIAFVYVIAGYVPVIPVQNMFYALLSVSAVAFFMTLFSKPIQTKGLILPDVLKFAIPSAVCITAFGLVFYAAVWIGVGNGMIAPDFGSMASIAGFSDTGDFIEYMSWSGSPVEEICARSALLLFVTLAGLGQIMMVSPYFRFLSIDGKTNKSLVPWFVIMLVSVALIAIFIWFPWGLLYIVKMVIFPAEIYALMFVMLFIWFFTEKHILSRGYMGGLSEFFKRRYLNKLEKEYLKDRNSGKRSGRNRHGERVRMFVHVRRRHGGGPERFRTGFRSQGMQSVFLLPYGLQRSSGSGGQRGGSGRVSEQIYRNIQEIRHGTLGLFENEKIRIHRPGRPVRQRSFPLREEYRQFLFRYGVPGKIVCSERCLHRIPQLYY
ncbi:MAG: HAD-IC family P-type ATPase, partial [Candidatus Methanomethylophilaceae archaeon]|nr:HAD-IC family P-type ATPase [Candidatus Methanomethylophilaceae archaeon]